MLLFLWKDSGSRVFNEREITMAGLGQEDLAAAGRRGKIVCR
jgi:hypothetical protein